MRPCYCWRAEATVIAAGRVDAVRLGELVDECGDDVSDIDDAVAGDVVLGQGGEFVLPDRDDVAYVNSPVWDGVHVSGLPDTACERVLDGEVVVGGVVLRGQGGYGGGE